MPGFLRAVAANWQLKLLAFALAVLLWVVVSAEQITSNWIVVPVVVELRDARYQVVRESIPQQIRVRFAGPGREFFDVAVRRPPLHVRINTVQQLEQVFELDPAMVRLPSGLEVTAQEVDPGYVRLRFRQRTSRQIPVRVRVSEPADGRWIFVDSLRVLPARVTVSGLSERIARLGPVPTVPISAPAGDSRFDRSVPLDTSGLGDVRITPAPARVRVFGRVERVADRRLSGLRVSHDPRIAVRPASVDVRVRGLRSAVNALLPRDVRVSLADDALSGRTVVPGALVPLRVSGLPRGVTVAGLSPSSVLVLPTAAVADSAPTPPLVETEAVSGPQQGEPPQP